MPRSFGGLRLAPPPAACGTRAATGSRSERLRVADVAIFYGERSGGIRTYLEAKAAYARRTGAFEHHLVIPGRPGDREAPADPGRHELRSLRLAASNGYRVPLGGAAMQATLRSLVPDLVLLHDPYWTPRLSCRSAHRLGATVVAVHHSSAALHAAGLPGPQEFYRAALRRWYRRAYLEVDAIMSAVDPGRELGRDRMLKLRLGLDPAFVPQPDLEPDGHVLYVGRLSREKGVRELLEVAAASPEPWRLELVGTGPAGDALRDRARALGLAGRVRFRPYLADRHALAHEYARARCVVLPGAYETFGLAALEAAACGAAVVTAARTPAAALLGEFVETFTAGDPHSMLTAITRARRRRPSAEAAAALGVRHSWDAAISAELADLRELRARSLAPSLEAREPGRPASGAAG